MTQEFYKTSSKTISFSRQFSLSTDPIDPNFDQLLFNYPLAYWISNRINSISSYVHFNIHSISGFDLNSAEKSEVRHISEYIDSICGADSEIANVKLHLFIQGSEVFIAVKRITDYLFLQVYQYVVPEDLLYYLLLIFEKLSLNRLTDQICMSGEIEKESAIVRLISIYFLNIQVSSNTLT